MELICAASDLCKLKAVRAPLLWRLLTCTAALAAALLSCLLSLDMYFTARHFHHPQVRGRMRGGGEWRGKRKRGWKVVWFAGAPLLLGALIHSPSTCALIPARQRTAGVGQRKGKTLLAEGR